MRGKPEPIKRAASSGRNIPAYAGKTATGLPMQPPSTEHPRVCGENQFVDDVFLIEPGTSPRMRGKHLLTCGFSFLRVILHSVLFFCTAGVPWNPPEACSFLSVLVSESSFTAGSGPACFRLSTAFFGGAVDNFQPFTVNNFPVMVMNSEIVSLLQLAAGERHDCPTRFAFLNDQFPKLIADTRVDLADECSGCHLGEPPGEVAPERFGAGCEHYGDHDASVA